MANTIITKNSSTASSVPTSGDLVQGELAVNVTDKRLFTENASGTVVELGTNPTTIAVAGNATVGGTLGVTGATTLAGASVTSLTNSGSTTLSGGTANGVAYLNGSKVVTSGSALTFNGSTFGVNFSSASNYKFYVSRGGTAGELVAFTDGTAQTLTIDTAASSILLNSANGGALAFGVSTEQMRLTSTGLGIGTSSPSAKLQINASGANPAWLYSTNGTSGSYFGTSGSGETIVYQTGAYPIQFYTNSTERMRLDSSGNLGLGVTPSGWASFYKGFDIDTYGGVFGASTNNTGVINNGYFNGSNWIYKNSAAASYHGQSGGVHAWFTAPSGTAGNAISFTQALTLDSNGDLLLNTTSSSSVSGPSIIFTRGAANETFISINHDSSASSGGWFQAFRYNGTAIGTITQSGTTAVLYNTSSDYRLKNINGPVTNSGEYIDSLKPVEGSWKADGSVFVGLLAHEAQEVSRTSVATGQKDGAEMQSMDYGNPEFIANIIAELQSLRKRVAELEAK